MAWTQQSLQVAWDGMMAVLSDMPASRPEWLEIPQKDRDVFKLYIENMRDTWQKIEWRFGRL